MLECRFYLSKMFINVLLLQCFKNKNKIKVQSTLILQPLFCLKRIADVATLTEKSTTKWFCVVYTSMLLWAPRLWPTALVLIYISCYVLCILAWTHVNTQFKDTLPMQTQNNITFINVTSLPTCWWNEDCAGRSSCTGPGK